MEKLHWYYRGLDKMELEQLERAAKEIEQESKGADNV